MSDSENQRSDDSGDSTERDAPVTSQNEPTDTEHAAGEAQAQENQETESPA
jgi:hypothetical protein